MRNPNSPVAATLRERLLRKGWPGTQVGRVVQEVAEHWDDLEAEGREEGLDAAAAAQRADERLGDVNALVRQMAETFRNATYAGRHPWLCFLLLPLFAVILWFLGWALLGVEVADLLTKLKVTKEPLYRSAPLVSWGADAIWYSGMVIIPLVAWRWATRSFCGYRWGWAACAICAVHGLFNFIKVSSHSVHWGYSIGWGSLHWAGAVTPLLAVALVHACDRARQSRALMASLKVALVAAGLLAGPMGVTGCASSKPKVARERGWIGGEYAEAKSGWRTGSSAVPAFPRELKGVQSKGILITGLRTNTPAYLGGLREGDLILKAGPQVMKSMAAFRKSVGAARPGSELTLSVYRDRETLAQPVTVGTETYEQWHTLTVGLMLTSKVDLWPDPDFSVLAVGYDRKERWLDLESPEGHFIQQCQAPERGLNGGTSWHLWLGLVDFGGHERILQQEQGRE